MKFPVMKKNERRHFNVSSISGGVNFAVRPELVSDNQLTECQNMWFRGGELKTRPPMTTSEKMFLELGRPTSDTKYNLNIFKDIRYKNEDEEYFLCGVIEHASFVRNEQVFRYTAIQFFWQGKDQRISLGDITEYEENVSYFVTRYKNSLYCFLSSQKIYVLDTLSGASYWRLVTDDEIYIPTLATDLTYSEQQITTSARLLEGATLIEGLNLLSKRFKVKYSTVNPDYFDEDMGKTEHDMRYYIPYAGVAREYIPECLEVYITHKDGSTVRHTATVTGMSGTIFYEQQINIYDNLKIEVTCIGDLVYITFLDANNNTKKVSINDYMGINMEIIAPCTNLASDNVFSMTKAVWFGGVGGGINEGTRLFIGVSRKDDEKNLVMWSDAEKPLYFPEYNYFYVGDSSCAVTGFGKQSDMLIIFKEKETYFTEYKQSGIKSGEIHLNGANLYERVYSYFPLSIISSNIGCDNIDTLELCSNRLVWVNCNGGVYTLVSSDRYSEKNIFEIGGGIRSSLGNVGTGLMSACDWEGHYVLFAANRIYLMDYNSSGYQDPEEYQINKDTNLIIPWYIWSSEKIPSPECVGLTTVDGVLIMLGVFDYLNNYEVSLAGFTVDCTKTGDDVIAVRNELERGFIKSKIKSSFTTKFFDFSKPFNRKNIDHVGIRIGSQSAVPVYITFLGDSGKSSETVCIYKDENDENMSSITLSPCIHSVTRMAVSISCDGVMTIDCLGIDYTLLGIVR